MRTKEIPKESKSANYKDGEKRERERDRGREGKETQRG